ncbi:MAG: serine/threonine protein kinase [Acidobacteria bacterium]|nr:serine/threonine protein kinase [Acidobacteriota bacterium]
MSLQPGTRLGVYEVTAQIGLSQKIAAVGRVLSDPPRMPGPKGPGLQLDEGLSIAKQIADALEAAHEQGIIHRDLKPANIKVRADGTVKVLDFGLAKAMDVGAGGAGREGGAGGLSMSPTMMSPAQMSGVGVILGTAAYMAPEQARGKAVDKRADIWAFGVVLYEMLSGRAAIAGACGSDNAGTQPNRRGRSSRSSPMRLASKQARRFHPIAARSRTRAMRRVVGISTSSASAAEILSSWPAIRTRTKCGRRFRPTASTSCSAPRK